MKFKNPLAPSQQITSQPISELSVTPTSANNLLKKLEIKRGNCASGQASSVTFSCKDNDPQTITTICAPFNKLIDLAISECK